jgi:hypothetical protein
MGKLIVVSTISMTGLCIAIPLLLVEYAEKQFDIATITETNAAFLYAAPIYAYSAR